jgi:hypothetical protein
MKNSKKWLYIAVEIFIIEFDASLLLVLENGYSVVI